MSDELLPYYNEELAYFRQMGAEFARAYPKIAGRLRLGPHSTEDPHVSRLIEAFAYLNARLRFKLDDDFPEITDAMLGVLYPQYLAPIPSMTVVQFVLDASQGEAVAGYQIPTGSTVETEQIEGDPCRFRTAYPVKLWPIEIVSATLRGQPYGGPLVPSAQQAGAVLHLHLRPSIKETNFAELVAGGLSNLRFFIKAEPQHAFALHERLLNEAVAVAFASSEDDRQPIVHSPDCLHPVGFEPDEAILPRTARQFRGYPLLIEYFAFPEKFLFVDLKGIDRALTGRGAGKFERDLHVYIYVKRSSLPLQQSVTTDTIRLGCTPIVNLFKQRAEPIQLTHTQTQYHLIPDARRPLATEIYSIDGVTAVSPDGEEVEYKPFYSFKHSSQRDENRTFWYAVRRQGGLRDGKLDMGTEMYLSLVDLDFSPSISPDWTVDVQTTCLSRDLPHHLPFGGDQPHLHLVRGGSVSTVRCLTPPTKTLRPGQKHRALWRLISHLSLNHLSIVEGENPQDGAEALREILLLYNFEDKADFQEIIAGLLEVSSQRVVAPCRSGDPKGRASICRGIEVSVKFDEDRFTGSGLFILANVLERFFALYCNVNSFTKMVLTTKQRGEIRRWAPRAGDRKLL